MSKTLARPNGVSTLSQCRIEFPQPSAARAVLQQTSPCPTNSPDWICAHPMTDAVSSPQPGHGDSPAWHQSSRASRGAGLKIKLLQANFCHLNLQESQRLIFCASSRTRERWHTLAVGSWHGSAMVSEAARRPGTPCAASNESINGDFTSIFKLSIVFFLVIFETRRPNFY